MAEGILRHIAGDLLDVQSAGSHPAGYVHPNAIAVLQEIGIDLSAHHSKHLDRFKDEPIHTVITVCDQANEACPVFPAAANRYHWSFQDPPHAALPGESEIDAFRRIRDQIGQVFGAFAAGCRQAASLNSPAS